MSRKFLKTNNFAEALKALRLSSGRSQESFGLVSSRTYLSVLERGLKSPTLGKVDILAQELGIHPLTLLTLSYIDLNSNGLADLESVFQRVHSELKRLDSAQKRG
ncbi:MAG: helix-turn-helix transcriptional regulator [Burkholderiales bacterium]|nr:helix-turn-helix transcriptional regulator [Burkholderiales bacterium]